MHLADGEDAQAARWLGRGGDAGDTEAQHKYAWLLLQGRGVIKDEEEAARWYSTAASHGDKYSYLALAELYASGTGVARDPVEAYALAAVADVVLDDRDLQGERLSHLKAQLGDELSPTQMNAANLRAHAMRPDLEQLRSTKEQAKRFAPIALLAFMTLVLGLCGSMNLTA
jgi:TPR repeat protein